MSHPTPHQLQQLQRRLGIRFRDSMLFQLSLTHRSWSNAKGDGADNERLEFLGDSILGLVVALWLYRQHQNWTEGQLTKAKSQLVSQTGLVEVAEQIALRSCIRVGRSQGLNPIPDSVVGGVLEAVLGAILLDGGYAVASRVIRRLWEPLLQAVQQGERASDYKSQLQEWSVRHLRSLPQYGVVREQGPAHARQFEVQVKLNRRIYGRATGRNKKEAEQKAAAVAWTRVHDTPPTPPKRKRRRRTHK